MSRPVGILIALALFIVASFYIAACIPGGVIAGGERFEAIVTIADRKGRRKRIKVRAKGRQDIRNVIEELRDNLDPGVEVVEPIVITEGGGVTTGTTQVGSRIVRPGSRPNCQRWYTVRRGDTQWAIAKDFSNQADKWQWIKGMRWVSRKSAGDADLKVGESVCVDWV